MPRYLVMAMRNDEFQSSVIEPHLSFLEQLRERGCLELAGPFTDKTGGAYLLIAESLDEAKTIADSDPLHTQGASTLTVYEWSAR